jgi:hypothetical protein
MPQNRSALPAVFRKNLWPSFLLAAIASVPLVVGSAAWAAEKKSSVVPPVRFLHSVPIPGDPMYSFDISWIDQASETYYLADRSNRAVDSLDASTDAPAIVTQITPTGAHLPFAGFTGDMKTSGPNGVATGEHCLFVTDAPSRVVSFDLNTGLTVGDVKTDPMDPTRSDELAYAPGPGLILAINNASVPPFGTLITVNKTSCDLTVEAKIIFDKTHALAAFDDDATGGAEQPVWDPGTQKFYLSIPEINGDGSTNLVGAVLRISTLGKVEAAYKLRFCGPAGLALGPNEDLLVGCNTVFDEVGGKWSRNADTDTNTAAPQYVIVDAKTGLIDANVPGAGAGDEVWFNPGDGHYYGACSGSPLAPNAIFPARPPAPPLTAQGAAVLCVVDAFSKTLDQLVPTFNVPQVPPPPATPIVHPAGAAHSVAANAENNWVFVPLAANNVFRGCLKGCVAVYGRSGY